MIYECGTCGVRGLIVESIAGAPWKVMCSNRHPFILETGDVIFRVDGDIPSWELDLS